MKYAFRFLALMAAASIVFFSCEKENATDVEEKVPGTTDPAAQEETNPGENPQFDPDECLLSFGASLEKTRVDIDFSTGDLTFEGGDEARVYNGTASAVYVYDEEGDVFNVKDGESPVSLSVDVQVFYPAGEFSISSDGNVIFTMPAAVTGDNDSDRANDLGAKLPLAGKVTGSSGEWSVTFKSVGSILKVGVTGARTLNSLTLSNTALGLGEGAEFTIGWDDKENPTMATTGTKNTSIAITGLSQDLGDEAVTYYFLLPAGVEYKGLKVTAGLDSEDQGGLTTYDIVRGNTTAARNKVVKMSFYAGLFSGGTGSMKENDPYLIANARDFKHISEYCTKGYGSLGAAHFLGAFYKQTKDINFIKADLSKTDLSDYMIGGASTPFTGTYYGDSKILSNFTISGTPSSETEGVAPIKAVNGAALQKISISDATISGGKFTAGLVGYAKGSVTIQECSISSSTISGIGDYGAAGLIGGLYAGTVSSCSGTDLTIGATADSEGKKRYYGGLISYVRGENTTVSGCSLNGTTTVNGTPAYFGGIVGQTNNDDTVTISDCHNHSGISGVGNFAGGIVGLKNVGSVEGCTNAGSVGGAQYVGGIVARNAGGSVIGCTNEGAIVSDGGYAGGIAGDVTGGTIKDCTNESTATFDVSGSKDTGYVGGIVGAITGGTITASDGKYTENKANINLSEIGSIGGIAGQIKADVTNVKNSGAVTGYYNIGGIGGVITTGGSVENALSSGDVSGYQNVGGISGKHGHNTNAAITKKISLKNCHVDGATITASADGEGRAGGIAGLVFAGSWIEGCTAFRGTVSGHQDVGGAIGKFEYGSSSSTDKSNRVFVGANLVAMNVAGLAPIQSTSRIGGFVGFFQSNKVVYTFFYQNGVVGGSITAEGCQYVGSFVGYASSSISNDKKTSGRIWDSYSLIEDANFNVTKTKAHVGGFAGDYGNTNVNSTRNYHVNSANTSSVATTSAGITQTTVADIRSVNLGTTETPTCNINGSAYTTTTWSKPDDVDYPVPTILETYGHYK